MFKKATIQSLMDEKKNDRLYFPTFNLRILRLTNGFPHEIRNRFSVGHHIKFSGYQKKKEKITYHENGQFRFQAVESMKGETAS